MFVTPKNSKPIRGYYCLLMEVLCKISHCWNLEQKRFTTVSSCALKKKGIMALFLVFDVSDVLYSAKAEGRKVFGLKRTVQKMQCKWIFRPSIFWYWWIGRLFLSYGRKCLASSFKGSFSFLHSYIVLLLIFKIRLTTLALKNMS